MVIALAVVTILGFTLVFFIRIHFRRMLKAQSELNRVRLEHERQLLRDSVEVQERERDRIASDLHDELIGQLSSLAIEVSAETNSTEQVRQKLNNSISTARRISHDLSPPLLEQTPFAEVMDTLFHPLKAHFKVDFQQRLTADVKLDVRTKLQLIRVVQEVLNNCLKHAGAKSINAFLHIGASWLAIQIADDGKGLDADAQASGLGLRNIALRSELLGAAYRFRPTNSSLPDNQGTTFTFMLNHRSTNLTPIENG